MSDIGAIGFSSGVGPLSLNLLGSPSDALGSISFGASGFAMANSALSLIAGGYGTGIGRSYSPFGFSGMVGFYGVGAPMVGSGYYIGPGPNFLDMNWLFMSLWQATFGPRQTMPAGPASQYAPPQPPPPAAPPSETGKKDADKDVADKGDADKAPASGKKTRRKRGGGAKKSGLSKKETREAQELAARAEKGTLDEAGQKRLRQLVEKYRGGKAGAGEDEKSDGGLFGGIVEGAKRAWAAVTRPKEGGKAGGAAKKPDATPDGVAGKSDESVAEKKMSGADQQRLTQILTKTEPRTDEEKAFVARMKREHPSFFKKK